MPNKSKTKNNMQAKHIFYNMSLASLLYEMVGQTDVFKPNCV